MLLVRNLPFFILMQLQKKYYPLAQVFHILLGRVFLRLDLV
jgi:hypothetical protein